MSNKARLYQHLNDSSRTPDSTGNLKVLNGVAANAAEASRTVEISTLKQVRATLFIDFTHSAGTAITVTPYISNDGTNWFRYPTFDVSSGTVTVSDATFTKSVTADDTMMVPLDCAEAVQLKAIIAVTNGGASDTFDVYVNTTSE